MTGQSTANIYNFISKVLQVSTEVHNVLADPNVQTFFPGNKFEILIQIGPLIQAFSNFMLIVGYFVQNIFFS